MLKNSKRLLVFLVLLLAAAIAGAMPRTLRFEHLQSTPNRTMPNAISSLVQDAQGFIWIGTQNGVYRHDGQRTTIYHHDPADQRSLPGDYTGAMFSDRHGRIWIGTNNGLGRFEPATNDFQRFGQKSFIVAITDDGQDGLWLGTRDGLLHFKPLDGSAEAFRHDPARADSVPAGPLTAIARDARGGLWLTVGGNGISYLAPGSRSFQHYAIPQAAATALRIDHAQDLWIGTTRGVIQWTPGQDWEQRHWLPAPAELPVFWVFGLHEDRNGRMWIGTQASGLLSWDAQAQRFSRYRYQQGDRHGLPSDHVYAMLVDRSETLWVGTWGSGMARADLGSEGLGRFVPEAEGQSVRQDKVVSSIANAGNGRIWLGGPGGLHLFDTQAGQLVDGEQHRADAAGGLPSNVVYAVHQQAGGTLWVATAEGLVKRDRPGQPFRALPQLREGVTRIEASANGKLWLSSGSGLLHLDTASGKVDRIAYDAAGDGRPAQSNPSAMMEDRQGRLWIGNPHGLGLDMRDPVSGQFTRFRHVAGDQSSLGNEFVRSLHQDAKGRIWVGTLKGLELLEEKAGKVSFRRVGPSLSTVYIESILSDAAGKLWIGAATANSEMALVQVDPDTGAASFYHASDGINDGDFYDGAAVRDDQGNLYYGTMQGLTIVQPSKVRSNRLAPELALVDVAVANRSITQRSRPTTVMLDGPADAPRGLVLPWDEASVQIEFAAMHFADPDRNRYAWRLDGLDRDWIQADAAHRTATYSHLPPGSYILHMKAASKNEVWSEPGLALAITIRPPFWATWWFRTVAVAATLLLLALAYRWRMLRMRWREEALKHLVDQRTAELNQAMLEQQAIFDSALTGIAFSRNKVIERCNVGFERILGYEQGELHGQSLRVMFFTDAGFERRQQRMETLLAQGKSVAGERRYRRKDGGAVWCSANVKALDETNVDAGMVIVLQDITARKEAEQALRQANRSLTELSMLDGLTGIANRRRFDEVVAVEWQRAARQQGLLGLALIDIDHFKCYNDEFGHLAGDQCLRMIAQQLAHGLRRSGDFVARYGGEEFVVVLPGQSAQEVADVLEQLRRSVEALALRHAVAAGMPYVTLSAGFVVAWPRQSDQLADVLEKADQCLYEAKRAGRNRVIGGAS